MFFSRGFSSYSKESFISTLRDLGEYPAELIQAASQVDRILFSHPQTELAYSWESPVPISWDPPLNMTAANLHMPALKIIYENIKGRRGGVIDNLRALDVGTGLGYVAMLIKHLFPSIYVKGIDVIPALIERAKSINETHFPNHKIIYEVKNVEDLTNEGNPNNRFDIIHGGATAQKSQITDILEMLNEGGVMVFPYRTDLLWMEELACWTKDMEGKIHGPISIAPVMYTPLVRSRHSSEKEDSDEDENN
jgi:protein-L-isoaspartate O-methyltransferase